MPYGYITTRQTLRDAGFAVHQIDNLLKAQNIIAVSSGVYRSPETTISWEGMVASLQKLQFGVTVGGLTALSLTGFQHYVTLSSAEQVALFYTQRLPAWVQTATPSTHFDFHRHTKLLHPSAQAGPLYWSITSARHPSIEFAASRPELALLETLLGVPDTLSFEHADFLMEGLSTLSPTRLHSALNQCRSIKVKRLFFWFAQRHQHGWAKKLNAENYNLGAGKRVLATPGKLDKTFQITVPEQMHAKAK